MDESRGDGRSSAKLVSRRRLLFATPGLSLALVGELFAFTQIRSDDRAAQADSDPDDSELREKFDFLSTHGNSNCSQQFLNSIPSMPDSQRLQGSCCAPMVFDKYMEQVRALTKYANIEVIPPDPYDIQAVLAKQLLEYDRTITPSADEQAILDEAVSNSHEKGYCCCMCWRWYTYEGLSKYLVRSRQFSAAQITDVLNNSDGCGGAS